MAAKVKFILGRAGSGKTFSVYSAIAENEKRGRRSFLIVPDRATFETERALSDFLGGGLLFASVLSFTRLAVRVLQATGDRRAYLSAQGRQMLIRRVLDESADELTAFRRVGSQRGFAAECDKIILNCKRFSVTPEQLFAAEELPAQLFEKLKDFALIYSRLNERMSDRFIDGEDRINALISLLPSSELSDADVFIDAPDMLNEQSVRIIEALFACARSVTLTLRAECRENAADARLFAPDRAYYRRLLALAEAAGCTLENVCLTENHRHKNEALAFLEANLFAFPAGKTTQNAHNIDLHSSSDRVHEVREAADRIMRAVKSGLRFCDIAVVVGDLAAYSGIIRRVFGKHGIPLFMDAGRPISSHPISSLILGALRCAENNFRAEDFIRVFKTGLCGISDEDCELLENHILKFGLAGARLFSAEPSVKNHDNISNFERIEAARTTVAAPLLALKQCLSESGRAASSRIAAVFEYVSCLAVADKLVLESERLMQDSELVIFALENRQIYDAVIDLFDQINVILGDEPIGLSRFISVVEEGLSAYEVNVIPTMLDQVLVGDVSAVHPGEIKLLLALGANEGQFPRVRDDNSIINDRDLTLMRAAGLNAWESSENMNRSEELNLYSVLFKATDELYFSYCTKLDSDSTAPCLLISRIGGILPHALRSSGLLSGVTLGSDEAAFADLALKMRRMIDTGEEDAALSPLYAHFYASDEYREPLSVLDSMFFDRNSPDPLGQDAALRLYGRRVTGTPTRLETFNRCPFCYFMQFGLSLHERDLRLERAVDHGTLIHDALDMLLKRLIDQKADFASLTKQDIREIMDEFLPTLLEEHNFGIMTDSAKLRAEAERLREELYGIAFVIVSQIASGSFEPLASELSFGREGDELPALELEGSNGVRFRMIGVVDRVDKLQTADGKCYFRIIDYKTGTVRFDYSELASGLRLQLPLYAAAVQAALAAQYKLEASGLYYMHVCDLNSVSGVEQTDDKALRQQMRLSGPTLVDEGIITASDGTDFRYSLVIEGLQYVKKTASYKGRLLVSEDEMRSTVEHAKQAASLTLDAIMEGRAEVSPSRTPAHTACDYCPYLSICRFDTTSGSKFRRIRAVTADQFYNRKDN